MITIVGAGFSGLTLAHALRKQGMPVKVIEREARPGGLISTETGAHGLIETAANALLANIEVEELFRDLQLEFAETMPSRRRRYIFWGSPQRWPLSLLTTVRLAQAATSWRLGLKDVQPLAGETVAVWAKRVVNREFGERLLAPALQGVYAGDIERMSANLILARMLGGGGVTKGCLRGSVAPAQGMGQLIDRLRRNLQDDGVRFEFTSEFQITVPVAQPIVLCTGVRAAEKIVRMQYPELSEQLRMCEALPLVSVTAFFAPSEEDLQGFGCLFPQAEGFNALGVLFNSSIFAGRSPQRSETWIFGGAQKPEIAAASDAHIIEKMLIDRRRLTEASASEPLAVQVTRWPQALPHYTVEWELTLPTLQAPRPLFLHGNYLGQLGLAQILHRSNQLARELKVLYGD